MFVSDSVTIETVADLCSNLVREGLKEFYPDTPWDVSYKVLASDLFTVMASTLGDWPSSLDRAVWDTLSDRCVEALEVEDMVVQELTPVEFGYSYIDFEAVFW